ncbi:unnamed protein product [marine sediment metagenome]|uniref:Quinolinate phosphoribosyl transferase C-terminal domain-containing protein n=1 Tax=marine sediment metagenome TaxID=412755 RepID=X1QL09_9ZZZZ
METKTVEEALDAAEAGADIVMLDNMSVNEMHRAVSLIPSQVHFVEGVGKAKAKDNHDNYQDSIWRRVVPKWFT